MGRVFVNLEDKNLDRRDRYRDPQKIAEWPLAPVDGADRDGDRSTSKRLYVGGGKFLAVWITRPARSLPA